MTIKEIIKLASDDEAMRMLNQIRESSKSGGSSTIYELKSEEKFRREKAKNIIEYLNN